MAEGQSERISAGASGEIHAAGIFDARHRLPFGDRTDAGPQCVETDEAFQVASEFRQPFGSRRDRIAGQGTINDGLGQRRVEVTRSAMTDKNAGVAFLAVMLIPDIKNLPLASEGEVG